MSFLRIADHELSQSDVQDLLVTDHPMVETFRFRIQNQGANQVEFALEIVPRPGVDYFRQRGARGDRIVPQRRTLSAGDRIGQGNRSIWVERGEIVAENRTFFPNQCFNDLGIGSALYVSLERFYRHLGVRRVTLLAVDVGVYVWARQGFAFQQPGEADDLAPSLERFVFGHGLPLPDHGALRESWDFAGYDVPGKMIGDDRVGKAFMLECGPPWHGIRWLDDPVHAEVSEQSRRETFARLPDKIEGASPDLAVR